MKHNYICSKGTTGLKKIQLIWFFTLVASFSFTLHSQENRIIQKPYLETTAIADTLVIPDRYYLTINMNEAYTKGRISTEEIEMRMKSKLTSLGIDLKVQLALQKVSSKHRRFFLKKPTIYKAKEYTILAYDIATANNIIVELEKVGITNIALSKVEFSKENDLRLILKEKAMRKALAQAEATVLPLNQKVKKAIYISDSNEVTKDAASILASNQMAIGCRTYYIDRYDISLGLKMNKIKLSSSIYVKFDLD